MRLFDLQFLLGHRLDLVNQVEGDDEFIHSEKFCDLDEEQRARFEGGARGRLFQLREIEAIDLAHPEQADAWLGPPWPIRKSLEELAKMDLPSSSSWKVRAILRGEG